MKTTYIKVAAFCVASLVGTTTSIASDPIANRQAMMKNVGASMRVAGGMAQGKIPFDSLAAELAMRVMNSSAAGLSSLFPDNSKTGGDTEAAPKIWEDKAGFDALTAKFQEASAAAITAAKAGEGDFKAAFGAVAKNCKACHQDYRIKKN
ncbi:MAG: cytochrome c [Rhizobiales bacterium]|nr:cytochrome c [Hyphomicrobiales bacterium]